MNFTRLLFCHGNATQCLLILGLFLFGIGDAKAEQQTLNVRLITDSKTFSDTALEHQSHGGMTDATNFLLLKALGLTQHLELLPSARITHVLQSEQPSCTFFRLRTAERSRLYSFSLETDIFLSQRIYQLASNPAIPDAFTTEAGNIKDISRFINSTHGAQILLIEGHSYGDNIDRQIDKIHSQKRYLVTGNDVYQRYMEMFFNNRTDLMIQYPAMLVGLENTLPQLRSYGISGLPEYVSGRVMCNKNNETDAFLERVDKALLSLYGSAEFHEAVLLYTPEIEKQRVQTILERDFISRSSLVE